MAGLASLSIDEQARPYLIAISPNQDGKRPGTTGIILHSTRSGKPGADDYYLTVNYFEQRGTASAHRVIGRKQGQHAQMVADEKIAWHAKEDNRYWLGIEFAQAVPADDYTQWQFDTGVAVCVQWCKKFGIEPSFDTIMRHQDTAQGKRDGKSDPGDNFPYEDFVDKVVFLCQC